MYLQIPSWRGYGLIDFLFWHYRKPAICRMFWGLCRVPEALRQTTFFCSVVSQARTKWASLLLARLNTCMKLWLVVCFDVALNAGSMTRRTHAINLLRPRGPVAQKGLISSFLPGLALVVWLHLASLPWRPSSHSIKLILHAESLASGCTSNQTGTIYSRKYDGVVSKPQISQSGASKATRKNYAGEKIRTMTIVGEGSLAGCIPIDYC